MYKTMKEKLHHMNRFGLVKWRLYKYLINQSQTDITITTNNGENIFDLAYQQSYCNHRNDIVVLLLQRLLHHQQPPPKQQGTKQKTI
jgi:hypothetical protein